MKKYALSKQSQKQKRSVRQAAPIFVFAFFLVGSLIMPVIARAQDFTPQIACWVCDPREYNATNNKDCASGLASGAPLPSGCRPDKPNIDTAADQCTQAVKEYCQQGLLPFCARTKLGCTSIGDFGLAAINYARFIFGISGSIALLFVIVGGVMMLFSFGNPEYMTKGKSTLTAAIVGLVIIFAAYLIVALVVRSLDIITVTEFKDIVPL